MIDRKIVCTVVALAVLTFGIPMVYAGSSNDLLRMDVKKSSAQDTVDVTFYTTGSPMNSVVTRKSGNSYVVLLPNVAGSQSVVPSLGGVKDLVSDITVKKVDDGIGGYTKVTFSTTRPVRIQTSTKQTAPLTSAQQDYKNLIAKSSNIKPVSNTSSASQGTQNKQTVSAQKQVASVTKTSTSAANSTATKSVASQHVKSVVSAVKATAQPKSVQKPAENTTKQVQKQTADANTSVKKSVNAKQTTVKKAETSELSLVKSDKKAKAETKVVNSEIKESTVKESKAAGSTPERTAKSVTNQTDNSAVKTSGVVPTAQKALKHKVKNKVKKVAYTNPIVAVAGAFCLFGIFLLAGLAGIITKGVEDKRNRLKEYSEEQKTRAERQTNPEFQAIMDDKKSNWQEKYKRYTKVTAEQKREKNKNKMSYIADVASAKGVIVPDEQMTQKRLQETISRMEHSLAQTPVSEPSDENSNKYHSEDDAILRNMSEIKLKSFAKPVDLSHTGRNLVSFDELQQRKASLKEGKFVKLNNSPLSVSRRKSTSSGMNFANIVRNGNKFANSKYEQAGMNKQQEEYIMSSLNEYMSMLDDEQTAVPMLQQPQELSKALETATAELAGSKSLVTNPMTSQRKALFTQKTSTEVNGLTVKSSYNIDSDKNIYMVDLDGISAIIGKIGEEIFVLKKFEKIINKPMQVRLDYGNTYIVRVGTFKCLVDVKENKMGTLLEI